MSIGDVYRVSIIGAAAGVQIVNTFHVRQVSGLTNTVESDVATIFNASCKTPYLACLDDSYAMERINVIKVSEGPPEGGDIVSTGAGTLLGEALPFQDAAVLSIRTGVPGRRYRGRMYIGPLTENYQASGVLSGAYITLLTAFGNAMLGAFDTLDQFAWVVWSEVGGFSTKVNGVLYRTVTGTVRRRRPGSGA